jgi:hypothetical protein
VVLDAQRLFAAVVVVSTCVLAGACTAERRPSETRCRTGDGRPITVQMARATLRAHGFTVDEVTDPVCSPTLIAELANLHLSGPTNQNSSARSEIRRREGHLICSIDRSQQLPDQNPRELIEETVGNADARWYVANVDCSIYAHEDRRHEQVARLRAALKALGRKAGG